MTDKGGEQEHVCRSDTRGGSAPALGQARWFLCLLSQGTATPQLPENLPQTQPRVSVLQGFPNPEAGRALLQGWGGIPTPRNSPIPKKITSQPCTQVPFPHAETPKLFSVGELLSLVPFPAGTKEGRARGAPKTKQGHPQIPCPAPGGPLGEGCSGQEHLPRDNRDGARLRAELNSNSPLELSISVQEQPLPAPILPASPAAPACSQPFSPFSTVSPY